MKRSCPICGPSGPASRLAGRTMRCAVRQDRTGAQLDNHYGQMVICARMNSVAPPPAG